MSTAILDRLEHRRKILMLRLGVIREVEAAGEGDTASLEPELILDEMQHLREVYEALLECTRPRPPDCP